MHKNKLLDKINEIPVIDTHEHLIRESDFLTLQLDFFSLLIPYVCDDLISSGMSNSDLTKLSDKSIPFEQRWDIFSPYLRYIRNTTYFAAVMIVLRDIYKINELTLESAQDINKIIAERVKEGIYDEVFSKCLIKACMTFVTYDTISVYKETNLIPVPSVSDMYPHSIDVINSLERNTELKITCIDDYEKAICMMFEEYKANNIKAIKIGSAYFRRLDFSNIDKKDAIEVFNDVLNQKPVEQSSLKTIQDYLTHFMIELARKYNMAVIFHIGIHAWNFNKVDYCHASYLSDLVLQYSDVRFVLLHGGIPFIDEAVLLAKYYPNVYLNMTWMHIIDREKSKEAIKRYIEMLPSNKIMAFGGDYFFIDNIYGHLKIAKENLSSALWDLVVEERITEEEALDIANLWFFENPKRFFDL